MMDKIRICVICLEDSQWNLQMISKARLFGTDFEITAVVFRTEEKEYIDYQAYGVHDLYAVTVSNSLEQLDITGILSEIDHVLKPELYMFPASIQGKEFAAGVAIALNCGLVADCVDITYEKEFVFVRTTNSDSVLADIACCNGRAAMCTVKKNIFEILPPLVKTNHKKVCFSTCYNKNYLKGRQILRQYRKEEGKEILLSEARIVLGIGRGCCDGKIVEKLRKLTEFFGAELAGTRAVVDDGILEYERQIGQSGKRIAPDVYIAFGISGAAQHIVGIDKSKRIIAVNKDKDAPIFRCADYAVVADCEEVIDIMLATMEGGRR